MTRKVHGCHSVWLLGSVAFLCMCVAGCHAMPEQPQPTPRDIEVRFFNSCIDLPEQLGPETCQDALDNFLAAFVGKAPSSVESR